MQSLLVPKSITAHVVAKLQVQAACCRTARYRATHLPSISQVPLDLRRFSSSAAAARAVASDTRAPSGASAPPAEPWRCHFEHADHTPTIWTFFEKATSTWQYIIADMKTGEAIIMDTVLDYDPVSGKISTATADGLLAFVHMKGLTVTQILETHAHADHLTAAQYMKQRLGGTVPVGIGARIVQVQKAFAPIYGLDDPALFQGVFDTLFSDEQTVKVGSYEGKVMHLPGHTPDHVGYVIGKAVFTGDSIFNPDVGSARADFPGGNVHDLYFSMKRLLSLPEDYRLFVGHDYPSGRDQTCSATVEEQRESNKHVTIGTAEEEFTSWRKERDSSLGAPRLLHPSLQVNIRGGRLPPADEKGRVWFKTPILKADGLKF
ncbi:hypothetical protein EIP91_004472 [Steccherinum ochraceum]|uniref:Metallo-beta-lactamase domain-containing protein n=1 Tax=Steccherinum ochraceum TaxID=92696 RepID=A0A4R0RH90_9APHY|nr:hypothetical protein EIP91_004472 [Steccherinum ochraceum]